MKYIFIVFVASFFVACGVADKKIEAKKEVFTVKKVLKSNKTLEDKKEITPIEKATQKNTIDTVEDLVSIPQEVSFYTQNISTSKLYDKQKKYEDSYFRMWNISRPPISLDGVKWPFKAFSVGKSFGENLVALKKDFFEVMLKKSNFKSYASVNKKALTLRYSNVRALPTARPLLRDPSLAGEGFPFDYLQNSSIHANTPLYISHYSDDKQWVYVFSNFAYGWLKSSEIVYINDNHAKSWQNAQQIFITQEGVPLYDEQGKALFDTRIGNMFALISESDTTYTILTVSSYKDNQAMFNKSTINKNAASKEILVLNTKNIEKIIKEVSKTNYGWGGIYGQRDCSSTLMDFYTPFGLWLPRNSSKQSKVGKVLNLEKLSNVDKIALIKKEAIPFETLLYKKGHIVLYAGVYKDEIIVFQNVWGIHTLKDGNKGRFIIGKPVFSTLKLGDELPYYDQRAELLRNLKSMNTLTR